MSLLFGPANMLGLRSQALRFDPPLPLLSFHPMLPFPLVTSLLNHALNSSPPIFHFPTSM